MRPPKQFFVYIMTNGPRSAVLYTGVTGQLVRRVWQHKQKRVPGFTSRYNLTRLVYYERFYYPDAAIAREKEIKSWRRSKKIQLIETMNPRWEDLAADWQSIPAAGESGLEGDPSLRLKIGSVRDDAFSCDSTSVRRGFW
jgi:putative endonuclease